MKPYLRLIGDVHGMIKIYSRIADQAEYSIQVGDMGFDYSGLNQLDSEKHKVLGGNHDNYEIYDGVFINQTKHFLGDYGIYNVPGIAPIFFVRGGNSIDKNSRTLGLDWWPEEEMTYLEMQECLNEYIKLKPNFVVSHECPESIIKYVSTLDSWDGEPIKPSATAKLLQQMFEAHQPEVWVFGHHHKPWFKIIDKTMFKCLHIMEFMDFPKGE